MGSKRKRSFVFRLPPTPTGEGKDQTDIIAKQQMIVEREREKER